MEREQAKSLKRQQTQEEGFWRLRPTLEERVAAKKLNAQKRAAQFEAKQAQKSQANQQQALKHQQRFDSLLTASGNRAQMVRNRADRFQHEQKQYAEALQAFKDYQSAVQRIRQNSRGKTISVLKTELDLEEQMLKQKVASLSQQASAAQNSRLQKGRNRGKLLGGAFQVQQILEDMSFAGVRGATNNLAFLASQLANTKYAMLGFAGIAGVATVAVFDLASSFYKWATASDIATEKAKRASDALMEVAETRAKVAEAQFDFKVPDSRQELRKRRNELQTDIDKATANTEQETLESDLKILQQMSKAWKEAKKFQSVSNASADTPEVAAEFERKADAARARWRDLRSRLSAPENVPGGSEDAVIANIKERISELQKEFREKAAVLKQEWELVEASDAVAAAKERIAEIEDKINDKLRQQISEEERLVEESKRRAEAVRDAEYSRRDAFGSKMLDAQSGFVERFYDKRVEAATAADRKLQEALFNSRFGSQAGAYRPMFDKWLEARAEAIKRAGERATERDQRKLATDRAKMLRNRAEQELATARTFAGRGDVENANRYFDRARDSFGQLQDMQFDWAGKASKIEDQQAFLREAQQTEKWMQGVANEAERAAEAMAKMHDERLKKLLTETTEQVKLLKIEAEDLEIIKPDEVAKATALEVKLKSILDLLEGMGDQGGIGAGPGAPNAAGGGGGLFSVPFGEFPSGTGGAGPANRDMANVFANRNPRSAQARQERFQEATAKRREQFQEAVSRREQHRAEGQERFRDRFAKLRERLKGEREAAAQGRAEARQRQKDRSGRLGAAAARGPMKGSWDKAKPDPTDPNAPMMHDDPFTRAKSYLPLVRQKLEQKEEELMGHPSSQHNLTTRTRKLYPLWQEKGRLERELEMELGSGRRYEEIGNRLQEILQEIESFEADKVMKKPEAGPRNPTWTKRVGSPTSMGSFQTGEGLLAPPTMRPGAGVNTSRPLSDFTSAPGGVKTVTQNNQYVSNVTVGSVVTQNMDANKFTADLAAQSKANFRRMGVTK
ncbi:MAG: hypothetical protein E6Q97_39590 [Desulfurellales bacterium]|nr:MAG: hypothetical protein E6Q97_39590 [Desulfurellales bacterium]